MKKKTYLGLGICALAIGAVAGVIGTRPALEAKADTETVNLAVSITVTNYDGGTMQKPQFIYNYAGHSEAIYVNSFTPDSEDPTLFTSTVSGIPSGVDLYCYVSLWDNSSPYTQRAYYAGESGAWYTIEGLAASGTLACSGAVDEVGNNSIGTFTYTPGSVELPPEGYYLIGSMTSWVVNKDYYVDGAIGKETAYWSNMALAKDDTFVVASYTHANNIDWDNAKRWSSVGSSLAKASEAVVDANDGDKNIKCAVAGNYNIYLQESGSVIIEPVLDDTSIYLATGNYANATTAYLYTWNSAEDENAPFPGVALSTIDGATCTAASNFNGQGGIWSVPTSAFKSYFKLVLQEAIPDSDPTNHESQDLLTVPGVFVAPEAWHHSASLGQQAKLVKDVEAAIEGATLKSVCNVEKETATTLVAAYDALVEKDTAEAATYYTWDANIEELTESTETLHDVTYAELLVQLRAIAESGSATIWAINEVTSNSAFVITISIVMLGVVAAGALYFISKKRRLQK